MKKNINMEYNKKILRFILVVFLVLFCFVFLNNSKYLKAETKTLSSDETLKNQIKISEEDLKNIKYYQDKIKDNLVDINAKMEILKKSEIYNKYPAVRLNVDTPVFGLTDVLEGRLRIKTDVTSEDIKEKYSLKNVVDNSYVIIPESYALNVLLKTKKVELNNKMLKNDYNTVIIRLSSYLEQAKETNNFLDDQINKIFSGYITGDEATYISRINSKISDTDKKVTSVMDDINLLKIKANADINFEEEYFEKLLLEYNENKKQKNISVMPISKLKEVEGELSKSRVKIYNYSYYIEMLSEKNKEYNLLNIVTSRFNELTERASHINEYIESSYKDSKLIYPVDLKDDEGKLKNIIEKFELYKEQITIKETNSQRAKTDETIATMNYDSILNEIKKEYINFVQIETNFYNKNIELLNKNSKSKLIVLNKNKNMDIQNEIDTTYLSIPKKICEIKEILNFPYIRLMNYNKTLIENILKETLINNIGVDNIYTESTLSNESINQDNINN